MVKYIFKRILFVIPSLLGVLILTFVILHSLPGDPIALFLGENATPEQIEAYKVEKGLDKPLIVQLEKSISDFFHGDLGESIVQRRPVSEMIIEKLPYTIQLAFAGILCATVLGVIFGTIAAMNKGKKIDMFIMGTSTVFMSMPAFLWGLLLVMVFGVWLKWIPVISVRESSEIRTLIAPAFALGISGAALIVRTTRTSMLEVLGEDYVRTAYAKGLRKRTIIFKHSLKAASLPILTLIGLYFADYLAGAVVIESIFTRPGIGKLLISAIGSRDYAVVQGSVVFCAVIMIVMNLITDILYFCVDPRIRVQSSEH